LVVSYSLKKIKLRQFLLSVTGKPHWPKRCPWGLPIQLQGTHSQYSVQGRANRNTVEIQRRGETAMHDYPISVTVPILPGDVIKVPERYF
jgi:hypothetical protein